MLSRSEDCALFLGRVFVAALFLPSGFGKLMAFSAIAASLRAKGLPYSEVIGPLALLIRLWPRWTALALICFTGASLWMAYGQSGLSMLLRPLQSMKLFERLAIMGGLLFYFSSGPGGWSRTSLR